MVRAAGAFAALLVASSCGSDIPFPAPFTPADCQHGVRELARLRVIPMTRGNSLTIAGGTLFYAYAAAWAESRLPIEGGILSLPAAGGSAQSVAAAANTSLWLLGSLWADGESLYVQNGSTITRIPTAPLQTPLAVTASAGRSPAFAHDGEFGYFAHADDGRIQLEKTPLDGRPSTTLLDVPLADGLVGGMADMGDALALLVRALDGDPGNKSRGRMWRVPKDGSDHGEIRPDVTWTDPIASVRWIAWDGAQLIAPVTTENFLLHARVDPAGTSKKLLKIGGQVAIRRGDEVLTLDLRGGGREGTWWIAVESSAGEAGTLLACVHPRRGIPIPQGIAADDHDIYLAYSDEDTLGQSVVVLAVVTP